MPQGGLPQCDSKGYSGSPRPLAHLLALSLVYSPSHSSHHCLPALSLTLSLVYSPSHLVFLSPLPLTHPLTRLLTLTRLLNSFSSGMSTNHPLAHLLALSLVSSPSHSSTHPLTHLLDTFVLSLIDIARRCLPVNYTYNDPSSNDRTA